MSTTLTELIDSRESGSDFRVLKYILEGTSDDATARLLARTSTATSYDGMFRQNIDVLPVHADDTTSSGRWNVVVRYGPKQAPSETGESSYQFDTGGGTQHITQSLLTVGAHSASGLTLFPTNRAIGVTSDSVEGVDITVPVYTWSETHYLADSAVDKDKYFAATGTTNSAVFRGFAVGEVLFLGASGSKKGSDDWEITFKFAASKNRTGLTVGSITGIDKKGWEYMWVRYADSSDDTAKAVIKKPTHVFVEMVYESSNFGDLGIG